MNDVLVLTDFSNAAMHALHAGADLVRKTGGTLHVLHTYSKPLSGIALQIEVDHMALTKLRQHVQEAMDHILAQECVQGLNVQSHTVADEPVWEVVNDARFAHVDLVLIGATGNTEHHAVQTGSVARKVIQFAEKPVLVIKHRMDVESIKDLVFASHFFEEAQKAFAPIQRFAEMVGAQVHLLKVITPAQFERTAYTLRLMRDFAQEMGLSDPECHVVNDISVEEGIATFIATHRIDLVAMETHGRKGLSHLFYGSTTEDVQAHVELPLLSTHI